MEIQYLKYGEYNMAYQVFGHGREVMLAFQGFGRDAEDFKILEPSLGAKYTIVSFDLFFHGNSDAPSSIYSNSEYKEFMPIDLKNIIDQYLLKHQVERFSLLAYSLGGRISFQIIEIFPDRIDKVLLFAPDGLKYGWWYNVATKTIIGSHLSYKLIKSPCILFFFLLITNRLGLLKNSVYKFLNLQLGSPSKRKMIFDVHIFFRNIHPNISKVQGIINEKDISLHLFFGRHDAIIPPSSGRKFMKGINDKKAFHILESGHHLIKESVNPKLKKILDK